MKPPSQTRKTTMGSFANWNAAASMKQWRERQEAALDAQRPLTEEEKNRWVTDDMKRLASEAAK